MPIYEYRCDDCKKDFEKLVFAGEADGITCPECNSPKVVKQMSAVSFMGSSIGTCAIDGPKQFS
ncbi:MAG TPA: zinc ribbon domain-containing protein [Desulfobacteraceae bacterium]|nr:zinc ribbon domain-containing protein [Desulfobacteraceae bacterium]